MPQQEQIEDSSKTSTSQTQPSQLKSWLQEQGVKVRSISMHLNNWREIAEDIKRNLEQGKKP